MALVEIHGPFLWLTASSYLSWSPCCFPILLKFFMLWPQPLLPVELTKVKGSNAWLEHRGTWFAFSQLHILIQTCWWNPEREIWQLCEIQLQPSPAGTLCFQSTPHCARDVTNCTEPPRKVRSAGWGRSDHFDLSPLWYEEQKNTSPLSCFQG